MKRRNLLYFLIVFITATFVACDDDIVKSDYDLKVDNTQAPTATTKDPIKVSAAYAELSGTSVKGTLDRGVLVSKTQDFKSVTVVPASADGDFTVKAQALTPNTTYYYRSYATNVEGGTGLGAIKSFKTKVGFTGFSIDYKTATISDWESAGFGNIDKDGDGESWDLAWFSQANNQICMRSYSWDDAALTPENYLLFPEIDFDGVDGLLTVVLKGNDGTYFKEKFKVVISNEAITEENCRDAEVLFVHTLANNSIYTKVIDIPAKFEGSKVYIAIAHFDCSDEYALNLLGATFSYAK